MGRQLALESPVDADIVVPVPDSGVTAAMGFSHESGIPLAVRIDPQSLRRPHLHRAGTAGARLRREAQAESGAPRTGGQARRADRRFHRARHHQQEDCSHGARRRRQGSAHAHLLPAHHLAVLLRRRHAFQEPADREPTSRSTRSANTSAPIRWPTCRWRACARPPEKAKSASIAPVAIPASIRRTLWTWRTSHLRWPPATSRRP